MSHCSLVSAAALATVMSLSSTRPVQAELPATLTAGDAKLVLNGSGARTKYFMQMYVAGLYLPAPNTDAAAIVAADAPMAIRLQITSGMVTQEKLVESLNEGFENATGGKTEPLRKPIEQFRACFAVAIEKGDVFDLVYFPKGGLVVAKNGKRLGVIEGLPFKQALFGIWLSEKPADKTLKTSLLAARPQGAQATR